MVYIMVGARCCIMNGLDRILVPCLALAEALLAVTAHHPLQPSHFMKYRH